MTFSKYFVGRLQNWILKKKQGGAGRLGRLKIMIMSKSQSV